MEGDEDPWPGSVEGSGSIVAGAVEGIMNIGKGGKGTSRGSRCVGLWGYIDLFGWKAIPFAREDLDSNCSGRHVSGQDARWRKGH